MDIGRSTNGEGFDNFGYPAVPAMRDRTTLLSAMAAHRFSPEVMSLGDAAASERVYASLVSGNYFEVVGMRPSRGTVLSGRRRCDARRAAGGRPQS